MSRATLFGLTHMDYIEWFNPGGLQIQDSRDRIQRAGKSGSTKQFQNNYRRFSLFRLLFFIALPRWL